MITKFPPVETADEDSGLLAIGGDLEIHSLELAYRGGIFPWPVREYEDILWFAPPERGILHFEAFKIPRRLQRELRKCDFNFRVNSSFESVIKECAFSRRRLNQPGTWITPDMIAAYVEFHHAGFAFSFETYNHSGELVGGLYGVMIGRYFAGESMFYKESNASKFALIQTVAHLEARGFTWMDIQMQTPLLENFGATEIPRDEFMQKLKQATQTDESTKT